MALVTIKVIDNTIVVVEPDNVTTHQINGLKSAAIIDMDLGLTVPLVQSGRTDKLPGA